MRVITLICAMVITMIIAGCAEPVDESGFVDTVEPHYRGMTLMWYAGEPQDGAPVMQFRVFVHRGDADYGRLDGELVAEVEINPGDGTGWHDAADVFEHEILYKDALLGTPLDPGTHAWLYAYSAPGTYPLEARATFWDGEVINWMPRPHMLAVGGS